ncbi:MAG: hypothetical protein RMK90_03485, partial [Acetobacteraceae bacterium]|nr:hypothetical protein [Acetobacteraceae bacterium]
MQQQHEVGLVGDQPLAQPVEDGGAAELALRPAGVRHARDAFRRDAQLGDAEGVARPLRRHLGRTIAQPERRAAVQRRAEAGRRLGVRQLLPVGGEMDGDGLCHGAALPPPTL